MFSEKRSLIDSARALGGCLLCWALIHQPWSGAVVSRGTEKAKEQISLSKCDVDWTGTHTVPVTESHLGNFAKRVPGSVPQRFCSFYRYGIETGCSHFFF